MKHERLKMYRILGYSYWVGAPQIVQLRNNVIWDQFRTGSRKRGLSIRFPAGRGGYYLVNNFSEGSTRTYCACYKHQSRRNNTSLTRSPAESRKQILIIKFQRIEKNYWFGPRAAFLCRITCIVLFISLKFQTWSKYYKTSRSNAKKSKSFEL